jgi:ankyrin repeat protein
MHVIMLVFYHLLDDDSPVSSCPSQQWGDTYLHYSCRKGNFQTTNFLIQQSVDINIINKVGLPPQHVHILAS